MTRSELQEIFRSTFPLPPAPDWDSVRYGETEGWDSLAHMQLITELEDRCEILVETDDVIDLSSFPRAIEILSKYGVVVDD